MNNTPLKFAGRFIYQSVKLILRIAFILTGGVFYAILQCVDNYSPSQENNPNKYNESDEFGYLKTGMRMNIFTGEPRDW
jgi:hypothetical protein